MRGFAAQAAHKGPPYRSRRVRSQNSEVGIQNFFQCAASPRRRPIKGRPTDRGVSEVRIQKSEFRISFVDARLRRAGGP
jgi:hypothetical protein